MKSPNMEINNKGLSGVSMLSASYQFPCNPMKCKTDQSQMLLFVELCCVSHNVRPALPRVTIFVSAFFFLLAYYIKS